MATDDAVQRRDKAERGVANSKFYNEEGAAGVERSIIKFHRADIEDKKKELRVAITSKIVNVGPGVLFKIDQSMPLPKVIEDFCRGHGFDEPSNCALRSESLEPGNALYVTEHNRKSLQPGEVLELVFSSAYMAKEMKTKIGEISKAEKFEELRYKPLLENLHFLTKDPTFVNDFGGEGLLLLGQLICRQTCSLESLTLLLKSFSAVMTIEGSWKLMQPEVLNVIINYISGSTKTVEPVDTIIACMNILEACILNSDAPEFLKIQEKLKSVNSTSAVAPLIVLMVGNSPIQHLNAVSLVNVIFEKSSREEKLMIVQDMSSNTVRQTFPRGNKSQNPEHAHVIYVWQQNQLNLWQERRCKGMDPHDAAQMKLLNDFRRHTCEATSIDAVSSPSVARKAGNSVTIEHATQFRQLGFRNPDQPELDLMRPPGALTLECLAFLSREKREFHPIFTANSFRPEKEKHFPIPTGALQLTEMLASLLKIGEKPEFGATDYRVLFFDHANPFFEFFANCMLLLHRTWVDMNAVIEDIEKVIDVVKEQIEHALEQNPVTFHTFYLSLWGYRWADIQKAREQRRANKFEDEINAAPILQMKQDMRPEIDELVKQNRINSLMKGQTFHKLILPNKSNNRERPKLQQWHWELSRNKTVFRYYDVAASTSDKKHNVDSKDIAVKKVELPRSSIKRILPASMCEFTKDKHNKNLRNINLDFAFALEVKVEELSDELVYLNFIAEDEASYDTWMDGISCLLSNHVFSKAYLSELEALLALEVKIRLLDLDGINVPNEPPKPPHPPVNYDFAYDHGH